MVIYLNRFFPGNLWKDFINHSIPYNQTNLFFRLKENFVMYWANFYSFSDVNLEKRKHIIFRKLCDSGICGVVKVKDDYMIYDIAHFKENCFHDVISGQGLIRTNTDSAHLNIVHKSNGVIVRTNIDNKSWFDWTEAFIHNIVHSMRNLAINRENSTKTKFVKVQRMNNNKKEEVKQICNPNDSFIAIQGPIEEIVDLSFRNETDICWEDVWNSLQFYMYQEGMRFNSLEKGAEVKEVESKNDAFFFEAIENQKTNIVKKMVDELNETYNTNITFKTAIQIAEEKEKQREKERMGDFNAKNEM